MDDLLEIMTLLKVPTSHLKSDSIQEVLIKIRKINNQSVQNGDCMELCIKILQNLWEHLQFELNEFDDQLLCSTCFYTILGMSEKQDNILHKVLQKVNDEIQKRKNSTKDKTSEATISIIYGMFQSSFLMLKSNEYVNILSEILNSVMNLLIQMAYEYSHHTFIVFKILVSLKKVQGTCLQDSVFTKYNQFRLLNLVNHNWENPINGIRNMNKLIFQMVIAVADSDLHEQIIEEVGAFYWNKAKYLMFGEIIEHYNGNIKNLLNKYDLVDGLIYSLNKPGLVSAGADMYYSILKKIDSDKDWKDIFLSKITQILNSSSRKMTENFNNYWCLTTLKKFPSVNIWILNELQKYQDSDQRLFSTLCIMKQSNKLNLIEKCWNKMSDTGQLIICSTEHCNPYIRMSAFDIICVTNGKSWPTEVEYKTILNFVSDNINSDCTVLRLSMINSLNILMGQLQILHLNNTTIIKHDLDNLLAFCTKLQELVITSLNFNGNYQRKITNIKIIFVVLNCLNEIPKKRQKQMKQTSYTLMKFLIDNRHWLLHSEKVIEKLISLLSDPADDIRENVLQVLLTHYQTKLKEAVFMNKIIDQALLKITSKFFYEINCGQSMLELVINILLKDNCSEEFLFKNVEDIFNFAYNELIAEYKLKRDIVESIEHGKQLHSYICILCTVFDASFRFSYKLQVTKDIIWSLLEILENTSNQFAWDEGVSTSSDFSKMSNLVQKIIKKSGYISNIEDESKITGLEQIVLNCLWLNVKTSCELSALIIQYYKYNDIHLEVCEKSLYAITKVLETSRHKGAIEAAGIALGESIKNLSSLSKESKLSELPLLLLMQKLKDLIMEGNKMASVTRRGAGLSIMFHRIVSNDMQNGKPLFHYLINTLLNTCKSLKDDTEIKITIDQEKDVPKAIYIHFLTKIVTDSSLTTEVMYYSAKLAELAFDNLTSPLWQIRNAALQLYGALIPKLIGQKKASGSLNEVTATVACDEFRTHFPKLWVYILDKLKIGNQDELQYHSNLLPLLNILGNIAMRYNFRNDLANQLQTDLNLLKSLTLLLGSPIFTMRRLTANSIFNMYSLDNIIEVLLKVEQPSENFLHGCLLVLFNCDNYYKNGINQSKLHLVKNKFHTMLQKSTHSYMCRELLENVFHDKWYNVTDVQEILLRTKNYSNEPGKFLWINTIIHKCLMNCPWAMVPDYLQLVLKHNEYEKYCDILYSRIEIECNTDKLILVEITNILMSFPKKMFSAIVWKILYKISLIIDLINYVNLNDIMQYLNDTVSYKLRYIIPFVARIATDDSTLLVLSKIIYKLCNAEVSDVDMRIIMAMANNEIARKLNTLADEIKIVSIMTAVIQLQDEDEDVRNLSVHFYKNISKISKAFHPYICLRTVLNNTFLKTILSNPSCGIKTFIDELSKSMSCTYSSHSDGYNPFTNESKNIYQEVEVVKQLSCNLWEDDIN